MQCSHWLFFEYEYQKSIQKFDNCETRVTEFSLWCVMPLSTIFQLFRCSHFFCGGKRSTRIKLQTCRKSLTNFITYGNVVSSEPRHELGLNSQFLVVILIGNDCTVSCKSNCHTITTITAPNTCTNRVSCQLWTSFDKLLYIEMTMSEAKIMQHN